MLINYCIILLYSFLWVIPRLLNFMFRRFGTLSQLHRSCGQEESSTKPMKMEQCSETSAPKIQTPRNHPKERIHHLQQGESLKFVIMQTLE